MYGSSQVDFTQELPVKIRIDLLIPHGRKFQLLVIGEYGFRYCIGRFGTLSRFIFTHHQAVKYQSNFDRLENSRQSLELLLRDG